MESLEGRTMFNLAAPEIAIDYPRPASADTVAMTDGDGPFFRYEVGDRDGLASVAVRITKDGDPTPVYERLYSNVSSVPPTDVLTNQFGLGTFHISVDATDNAPPAERLSSSKGRSLVVTDDDTTPPGVAFTEPRLDPMTDGDWEPFKWLVSADASRMDVQITRDGQAIYSNSILRGGTGWADNGQYTFDYGNALGTYVANVTVWDNDNDRPNDSLSASASRSVTIVDDDTTGPLISFFYPRNQTVCVEDPTQPFDFEILDPNTSQPGDIHIVLTRDVDGSLQTIIDKWVNGNHEAYREEIGYVQYGTGVYTLWVTASNDDNDRPNDTETSSDSHSVTVVDCHPAPKPAALGDFVWNDLDQDGIQDAGEPGIPAVTVKLYDCTTNALLATTTTDANGLYQFTSLTPASYHVEFVAPGGYQFSPQFQGGAAADSNADATGQTPCVTLASGETNNTIDAGLFRSRPGINIVKLTNGTDNDSPTGPVVPVGSTVTWSYIVTNTGNVPLGNVTVLDDHGTPANAADDFAPTFTGGDSNGNGLLDVIETWAFSASGIAVAGQYENFATASGKDSLGQEVTDDNQDHYFGAQPAIDLVKLTNGTDNNSPTGPVVPVGSTVTWSYVVTNTGNVTLFNVVVVDDNGTPGVNADDFTVGTITSLAAGGSVTLTATGTAKAGQYENYATATGRDSTGATVSDTDLDHYIGYANIQIGDFVWYDIDADGLQDAGEPGIAGVALTLNGTAITGASVTHTATTDSLGKYLFTEIPGTYTVTVSASNFAAGGALSGYAASPTLVGANRAVDSNLSPSGTTPTSLPSGASDLTLDFGYYKTAAIGDYVFSDCDGDGIQDADEVGVANVTVKLLNGSGTTISTTTTNAGGLYSFSGLAPGNYSVQFAAPAGYRFTTPDQGGDDAKDSDANVTTGKTGSYTLTSGQVNNTVDAGVWRTRSLSGYVYDDADNDGVFDATEPGIPGVAVTLTDAAGNPVTDADGNVVAPTTTAADGSYGFANLKPGTYRIVEAQPAGWSDGKDTVGSLGGTTGNDVFSNIVVRSCGDNGVNYNFGEVGVLHGLTGTIGWWMNNNGQRQINLLGATSTTLGNWLAASFPNMYGSKAGLNNFANKDRSYVAQRFLDLFNVQGQKLDAQVLGVCLAIFTTTKSLNSAAAGQAWASQHGFKLFDTLTSTGSLYSTQWNVGTNGEAFATTNALKQLITADGQSLTVWTLLQRTNSFAVNGVLYANGATINGVSYSSTDLRNEANVVFSGINQAGDIYS